MDSKNALLAILGGVALTTIVGIILTPYKNSLRRKNVVEKAGDYTDPVRKTIRESVADVKNQVKIICEDADQMVNKGRNAV